VRPIALLVDDDSATLQILPDVLRLHLPDVAIDTSTSPTDALHRLAARSYHVVLSDVRMPGMDGLLFLENVRTIRRETFVVLTTGGADPVLGARALAAGAFDFLPKPFDGKELAASLHLACLGATIARTITALQRRLARLQTKQGSVAQPSPDCVHVTPGLPQHEVIRNRAIDDQALAASKELHDRLERRRMGLQDTLRTIENDARDRALARVHGFAQPA